jgi:hypothetical protein
MNFTGKMQKRVLLLEMVVFVLPIFVLFILGGYEILKNSIIYPSLADTLVSIIVVMVALVFISMFRLFLVACFNKNYSIKIDIVLVIIGGIIAIASLISNMLPLKEDYSAMWQFRTDFNLFALGLPLVLVATHLAIEALNASPTDT